MSHAIELITIESEYATETNFANHASALDTHVDHVPANSHNSKVETAEVSLLK